MDIRKKIKENHVNSPPTPNERYFIGFESNVAIGPDHTGRNMRFQDMFCWFDYSFNDKGQLSWNRRFAVMYDYRATKEQKLWFNEKCADLFKLGFNWSEASGTFSLLGTWSCYWEQVNNADNKWWSEYIVAINEAIGRKEVHNHERTI